MDIAQYWLTDLPDGVLGMLRCPRCECMQFTAEGKPYGIELACWKCPTYIGIRCVVPSSPESASHGSARSRGNENADRDADN